MKTRIALLAAVAANTIALSGAQAATHKHHTATKHAAAKPSANAELLAQVKALQAQVESMRAEMDAQKTTQVATQAQVQATQTQVQQVQTAIQAAPPVTQDQVKTQISSAIDKEHHNDKFYFKGITITPGGFVELAGIYRDHFQGNDISSNFNNVNFPNARQYHQHEGRFSARQSRVSLLAEGAVNKNVKLSMYGEFDFQGAAQTADSNQSNSYNPRIRNLYGTIDWNRGDYGLHLLAGQNWSLLTMQSKGITPRAEVTPPQIDAQYIPGFAWARQPGVRLAADFMDHKLWLAVAAENPQNNTIVSANGVSTNGSPVTAPSTEVSGTTGGRGFDALNNNSFSDVPDFIGKVAYEGNVAGHGLHLEGFGIVRTFNERLITGSVGNNSVSAAGYGGSINLQVVPKLLDVQFSYMGGKGIGRYGSAGLPDVAFSSNGRIHPLSETMLLAGATLHANKQFDLYLFAGSEQEKRDQYAPNFGAPTTANGGCFIEGGACGQNTRRIRQITGGFWDKFYQGSFGRAQVGIQYSYTQRQLFLGTGYNGYPQANNSMAFVSFRYYPF
jgi:hypothetical protein